MGIVIKYRKSRLIAVPAVHFRMAFAAEVNRVCNDKQNKPDAIAVELEPEVLAEAMQWIRELTAGSEARAFPTMLGLADFNTANDGNEGKAEMHCLSVTDSIIEAIRCGIELNIPVFGVDTSCYYQNSAEDQLIEDAGKAGLSFNHYIISNEDAADRLREPLADGRREVHMAGRLKHLLSCYQTVVFTCGLAHWKRLKQLISDEQTTALEPAPKAGRTRFFKRVVVHPLLALRFMDKLPSLGTAWDQSRQRCGSPGNEGITIPDVAQAGRDILEAAYARFTKNSLQEAKYGIKQEANPSLAELEAFVQKYCLVGREMAPGFQTLQVCAKALMPKQFSDILVDLMMDIKPEWASTWEYPHFPLVVPSSSRGETNQYRIEGILVDVLEPSPKVFDYTFRYYVKTGTYLLSIPTGGGNGQGGWQWPNSPVTDRQPSSYNTWVWPPCEALLFGTAYQAGKTEFNDANDKTTVPFEGSLYDGFDVKATIRSMIRGGKVFQVKMLKRAHKTAESQKDHIPAAVVIFTEQGVPADSEWYLLMAGTNIGEHVADQGKFKQVVSAYGRNFISSISYGCRMPVPDKGPFHPESIDLLHGITLFGDPCLNAVTGARWVENGNFKSCPVIGSMGFNAFQAFYLKNHQVELGENDWQTTLILAAIPYAASNLVVMAPDGYVPGIRVKALASAYNVRLHLLPLSHFPAERINQMRRRILVRSIDPDGFHFPDETAQILGQSPDSFMDLLPDFVK
ncbi:MAG: hypothetical protein AB9834_09050 [Lentimicrobium sp.]